MFRDIKGATLFLGLGGIKNRDREAPQTTGDRQAGE